eukprot:TRINITY_DN12905_c0_g1_i2.p2 TRINITY_DN12905_c0_g1~~TRINITY_DN12905_c0_g1_i2.p2  ORF type:complete len:171 (-),score=38.17 TRINITY_DN12905_c0_g1_i2:189-701(-)
MRISYRNLNNTSHQSSGKKNSPSQKKVQFTRNQGKKQYGSPQYSPLYLKKTQSETMNQQFESFHLDEQYEKSLNEIKFAGTNKAIAELNEIQEFESIPQLNQKTYSERKIKPYYQQKKQKQYKEQYQKKQIVAKGSPEVKQNEGWHIVSQNNAQNTQLEQQLYQNTQQQQ